ncbi:uncharacterized protein LOC116350875 [Contarinia nasturtii]|uniref:uncharacterized protein LOC116350875 n=1 Tax=Contarinia nasturtii TaxID=265458 RepID=UPI0012D41C91|nr:uncharacterized protein LOC116350875 [Contarinia nasturtii]
MLYLFEVFLFALTLANALPTAPVQSEQEISDNDIDDNDFSKELPFEAEYYRTSTDRDEFVRPIASPKENEIDEGEDGIDLDDLNTFVHTPDCTYHIAIRLFYESIDELEIKLEGLTLKNDTKSNISLSDFVQQAQLQIVNTIKEKMFTNELVNDVINYLRQTFVSAFGFENNCGVSTTVVTYFTKNDTQVDGPQANEDTTDVVPTTEEIIQNETDASIDTETSTSTDDEEDATEEYQSKTLIRPKLSDVVQDVINVYKALHNWRYSQQA